jgi:hypothetical protein
MDPPIFGFQRWLVKPFHSISIGAFDCDRLPEPDSAGQCDMAYIT